MLCQATQLVYVLLHGLNQTILLFESGHFASFNLLLFLPVILGSAIVRFLQLRCLRQMDLFESQSQRGCH